MNYTLNEIDFHKIKKKNNGKNEETSWQSIKNKLKYKMHLINGGFSVVG